MLRSVHLGITKPDRLVTFSDGVFAIAATLLVLDIRLPDRPAAGDDAFVRNLLAGLLPQILAYVLSFVIVVIYHNAHHRMFHYIVRADSRLVWLNALVLLFVAFLPFPTALLNRYGDQPAAVAVYAGTLALTGLAFSLLWWYATYRRQLVSPTLSDRTIRFVLLRTLGGSLIFVLSIPLVYLTHKSTLAEFSWLLLVVYLIVLGRIYPQLDDEPVTVEELAGER